MLKVMYSCDQSWIFSQSSVSRDPSEIMLIYWFTAQETFMIIINVENGCAESDEYFCLNWSILCCCI